MRRISFDHLVTLTGAQIEHNQQTIREVELDCLYDGDILPIKVILFRKVNNTEF